MAMKVSRIVKYSAVALSLMVLSAISNCAVRTRIQKSDTESLKGNLRFERVYFKEFSNESNKVLPFGVLSVCRESGIAYLGGKGVFRQVDMYQEGLDPTSAALVEAQLLDIRIVSTAARAWGGAFAGRSHMKMKVRLMDAGSGEVLAEQELFGAPNAMGSTWSFGSSDQKLPAAMGALIGDFVLANARSK